MPSTASYSNIGTTDIDSAVGVALSGVMLFNGLTPDSYDPFYPAVDGVASSDSSLMEVFDECL